MRYTVANHVYEMEIYWRNVVSRGCICKYVVENIRNQLCCFCCVCSLFTATELLDHL